MFHVLFNLLSYSVPHIKQFPVVAQNHRKIHELEPEISLCILSKNMSNDIIFPVSVH